MPLTIRSNRFDWDRPLVSFEWEDSSYIDTLIEAHDAAGTPLELFLGIPEHSPRHNYEFPVLNSICPDSILLAIRQGTVIFPNKLVVWLHDRSLDNGVRSYNGVQSPRDFHQLLKLKRFSQDGQCNAEARLMHITNPDQWAIGPLILTASQLQIPVYRELFMRHLEGDSHIRMTFSPCRRTFALQFHLPFFAWRRSKECCQDVRSTLDGVPIRDATDVSFLSTLPPAGEANNHCEFLYEAQSSLAVFGWNRAIWTACSLTDSYFYSDAKNPNNEDLLTYYEDIEEIEWDAISMAELPIDHLSIKDPREYFLMILKIRGEKCKDEWRDVLYHMKIGIRKYLRAPHVPRLRQKQTLGNADNQAEAIEKSEAWVKEVNTILTRLTGTLSKTITACDTFSSRDAALIEESFEPSSSKNSEFLLYDIAIIADELRKVWVDLKELEGLIEKFKAQVSVSYQQRATTT
ncbi:hypothetical protein CNYM01_12405 [Colletotrichum nymphaeae SA-01]|uniref:Uncharacterized protein n=1 Tax=Colletotrichum nymphaeae SA-01 TaxID=1460502 RepID=A0A135TPG3_9PEZI|nr:hypothetical protein CNYM01_12405 [Colletotrichum nymphaeae SA-01]